MRSLERWQHTWALCEVEPPEGLLERLIAAYEEPHRAYHTLQHVSECFAHLDESPRKPADPVAVELAVWFHDAIYDTRAADSEARSAAWAHEATSGVLAEKRVAAIEGLVLVTQHNTAPTGPDQELFLDIDLSILGATPVRFAEYEAQVRKEYHWVPEEAYRGARATILRGFQSRPVLFHTAHFRDRLEAQARKNLQCSLDALSA